MRLIKIKIDIIDYSYNWWINNIRHVFYIDPLHIYFSFELDSEFLIKRPKYKNDYSFYLICG